MSEYHRTAEWKRVRTAFIATQNQPYECELCGKSPLAGMQCHVDHIISINANGGEPNNDFDNLRIICDVCNGKKSRGDKVAPTLVRTDWSSDKW